MNRRSLLISLLVITIILILGGFGYYLFTIKPSTTPSISLSTPSSANQIADWQTYKNKQYGFQIDIPSYWTVSESTSTDPGYGTVFYFTLPNDKQPLIIVIAYPHGFQNFSEPVGPLALSDNNFDFYISDDIYYAGSTSDASYAGPKYAAYISEVEGAIKTFALLKTN